MYYLLLLTVSKNIFQSLEKSRVFSPVFIWCFYLAASNSDGTSEHSLLIYHKMNSICKKKFSSPDLQTESLCCTYMGINNAIYHEILWKSSSLKSAKQNSVQQTSILSYVLPLDTCVDIKNENTKCMNSKFYLN